eukprot:14212917-Ditylum_brightwellii.AAC.1
MPITPAIIKQVNKLAALDKMPNGLKIANKANNILFNSTQIAGVDYDEQEFNNNNNNKSYSDKKNYSPSKLSDNNDRSKIKFKVHTYSGRVRA